MTRIYVVTNGVYSDMYIAGASTNLADAARIIAEKACVESPAIEVFEGRDAIEGEGTLHFMYCNVINGNISSPCEGVVYGVPENATIRPIVKAFPDANWGPQVFVIGTERSKVAQAFSDTLAAEATKRGWQ